MRTPCKFPRTPHLLNKGAATRDDLVFDSKDAQAFLDNELVVGMRFFATAGKPRLFWMRAHTNLEPGRVPEPKFWAHKRSCQTPKGAEQGFSAGRISHATSVDDFFSFPLIIESSEVTLVPSVVHVNALLYAVAALAVGDIAGGNPPASVHRENSRCRSKVAMALQASCCVCCGTPAWAPWVAPRDHQSP